MKKLIILLCALPLLAFGQIEKYGFVEFGYCDYSHNVYNNLTLSNYHAYSSGVPLYALINVGFNYKRFHLINSVESYMSYNNGASFSPKQIEYVFNAEYKQNDNLSFGYKHSCTHPIFNNYEFFEKMTYRGSYDKIYIKIKFD